MPINKSHKILFIHIPKCGGTSIEKFFQMQSASLFFMEKDIYKIDGVSYAPQHLTPKQLKAYPFWNEYFKFTIVRNPYHRVLSEYLWTKNKPDLNKFNNWLDTYYSVIDKDHKLSQVDYLDNDIDMIIKLENINKEFDILLDKINWQGDRTLYKHNSTNSSNHYNLLNDETKSKIYNLYKEDFKQLNYDY